jgi:hypothetical protein
MDWKLKLFQVLDAIGTEEGVIFKHAWLNHGITPEERDIIFREYAAYMYRISHNKSNTGEDCLPPV